MSVSSLKLKLSSRKNANYRLKSWKGSEPNFSVVVSMATSWQRRWPRSEKSSTKKCVRRRSSLRKSVNAQRRSLKSR